MSDSRLSLAASLLKAFAFLACAGAFVWKVTDSAVQYLKFETGTNVRVDPIAEAEMPLVAVCRHPHQVGILISSL